MRMVLASPEQRREIVSRRLLRAMGLLVAFSLALATFARLTDRPLEAEPVDGRITRERMIRIFADMGGAARVLDDSGTLIADLPSSEGGFIAGVWRAVVFERRKAGVDPDSPVRLMRFSDGRLALRDETSGTRIELLGFGADNVAAFARLLDE